MLGKKKKKKKKNITSNIYITKCGLCAQALCETLEESMYTLRLDLQEKDAEVSLLKEELELYKSQVELLSKQLRWESVKPLEDLCVFCVVWMCVCVLLCFVHLFQFVSFAGVSFLKDFSDFREKWSPVSGKLTFVQRTRHVGTSKNLFFCTR